MRNAFCALKTDDIFCCFKLFKTVLHGYWSKINPEGCTNSIINIVGLTNIIYNINLFFMVPT